MNHQALLAPLVVAASAILALGCIDPTIVGGEGGAAPGSTNGSSASTTGVVTVGTGAGAVGSSTAWLGADLAPATFERVCQSPPQCSQEADVLYLFIDSQGSTCALPLDPDTSVTAWEVVIGVPPSAQYVGLHAMDESFFAGGSRSELIPTAGVVTVGATGGSDFHGEGTLEILELSDTIVRFSLTGVSGPEDGAIHVASRCGSTVVLPPEGIALAGDVITTGGAGGGPAADADGVTVVVGDSMASCGQPLLEECTGSTWQVAVHLPEDYLVPGRYSMADPRIASFHCAETPGELAGVIEVFDLGEDHLVVRFEDVGPHAAELEQDLRIDRCP